VLHIFTNSQALHTSPALRKRSLTKKKGCAASCAPVQLLKQLGLKERRKRCNFHAMPVSVFFETTARREREGKRPPVSTIELCKLSLKLLQRKRRRGKKKRVTFARRIGDTVMSSPTKGRKKKSQGANARTSISPPAFRRSDVGEVKGGKRKKRMRKRERYHCSACRAAVRAHWREEKKRESLPPKKKKKKKKEKKKKEKEEMIPSPPSPHKKKIRFGVNKFPFPLFFFTHSIPFSLFFDGIQGKKKTENRITLSTPICVLVISTA